MNTKPFQLTMSAGNPVADNQNSIAAGPRGPLLMQDYQLLEKPAHQNGERIPDVKGDTPPMLANYTRNLETTRELLGQSTDVDQTSLGGVALQGYGAERDDSNGDGSPAIAAAAVMLIYYDNCAPDDPIRILTIAAALLAAEIDRLQRKSMTR
jgi:hypothetical protein